MNRVERAGGVKPTYPVIHVLWAVGFLAVEVVAAVRHSCDELRRTDEWVSNDEKPPKTRRMQSESEMQNAARPRNTHAFVPAS